MKIRLITTLAGPHRVLMSGSEADVDPREAKALIAGGFAEAIEQPVETQARTVAENTAKRTGKPPKVAKAPRNIPGPPEE
jgi:hypothetical protein